MDTESEKPADRPKQRPNRVDASNLDFNRPAKLIAELLAAPDFPKAALGELVDIGGYTGVVVDIVNQSLKVRSPEGVTKSFNAHGLRRIYGPRPSFAPEIRNEPPIAAPSPDHPPKLETVVAEPEAPAIIEPDFSKPVKKIAEFVERPDYPGCVLSEHIDVNGYTGVVVQIVNRSLKVRSAAETTRSYNADALRKIFGAAK